MNILQHTNKSLNFHIQSVQLSQNDSKQRHHTFSFNSNHININCALGDWYTFLQNIDFSSGSPLKKYTLSGYQWTIISTS